MPPKRKSNSPGPRAAKSSRTSKASTPGLSARQSDTEESDQEDATNFSIDDFPYILPPGVADAASAHFEPAHERDFTALTLKRDHPNRPLWIDGWGKITLENFHWQASRAQDFLITVAEPRSRPSLMHEYKLTKHSLYAAVSVGLSTKDIVSALERFSKNGLPPNVIDFITECGRSYGKVKLVLRNTKYMLETTDRALLQQLLQDSTIRRCRAEGAEATQTKAPTMAGLVIAGTKDAAGLREAAGLNQPTSEPQQSGGNMTAKNLSSLLTDDDDEETGEATHVFEIKDEEVSTVTQRCLKLGYPALVEYDFRNDNVNPDLDVDLRPATQIRPYQERSLSKMFGNGLAKSGIIVLPCGAGKTRVGITAACTIKKGVVVLATGTMAAIQWRDDATGVIVTTYSMVTNNRNRARDSAKMMEFLASREWGLMLLDEVHVVPAQMFRRVIGSVKAHSKLGLTATLLREDDKIDDLNYLIGPKLYEANWQELSQQGHIARVQCAEVWCPMPFEFLHAYRKAEFKKKPLFSAMNPNKYQACQYLIKYHESRGDKIIVFSDNLYALEVYAKKMMKPFLCGSTSIAERTLILDYFRNSPDCSTLFLSKIGDTSLDLPEATVLIQISAQFGSRRQEAQRLGRVLRAKRRNEEGFNAFFYSLVSTSTMEMGYSAKRQVFLVDQGYAFRIITQLKNIDRTPDLEFTTPEERLELLKRVLVEAESKSWKEEEEKEARGLRSEGDLFYSGHGKPAKKGGPGGKGTAGTLGKPKEKPAQSDFFRAMAREKKRVKKEKERQREMGDGSD